ncbi:hypothetical protein EJ02DRAFT_415491 [Clathrospora elynae]|uniref:Cyclochlorotine biosynthesis protein O n=1 Tax=Clathrospora elynae TaxID=706981 RepID=A0A6A5S7U8_9PLEO|nr:hypothetical protein EJ02DRAFT_415491 [Clathrospora elynae]
MTFEHKRLLDGEDEGLADAESQHRELPHRTKLPILKQSWLPVALVVYSVIATVLLIVPQLYMSPNPHLPYSPITDRIQSTVQNVYPESHSVFSKEPSEDVNAAWAKLVAPMLIQATESEVKATNEDPAERLELIQGGYLGSLGVFHELHCLRRLYWHMYDEIYFANMTEMDREYERGHARHCIETLRLSLMCQANTALYTFEWDESRRKKQHLTSKAQRQCIRWDPVYEWASGRSVGLNPQFHVPNN